MLDFTRREPVVGAGLVASGFPAPATARADLLPAATTKVQIKPGLSLSLDEKPGSGPRAIAARRMRTQACIGGNPN